MKFHAYSFAFVVLAITCFCVSCRKSTKQQITFPEATQEGKNTFGSYIDGDQFIAASTIFGLVRPINVAYYYDSTNDFKAGSIFIQGIDARSTLPIAGFIAIQKMNVFGTGTFPLTYVSNCSRQYTCDASFYYNSQLSKNYFADSGELTISKLDTVNRIISGTFHFTAKDSTGVKKEITNGRFDVKYNQ